MAVKGLPQGDEDGRVEVIAHMFGINGDMFKQAN